MRTTIIALVCLLHFHSLSAQVIKGEITDTNRQPVAYANIVALQPGDSAFVQGTVSDESGLFRLEIPGKNTYIIKVSCIGYQTEYRNSNEGIGTFMLKEDMQILSEVEIKGKMPVFQLKGDRFVTQVAGSLLSKAGSANDVLERIPGVEGK
ncbi:MAG: carboxypeptidase-like regulatory domain-containing protein [Parabacteroides sp.]|nr:carboxypeptidase-like regulatory domain-containing protein [Parabacteroides sp.]